MSWGLSTQTYFKAVKRDLTQRDQPRLLTRYQHLIEIERQAEVPKRRRVVRTQANRDAVVQHRGDRVHGYRGGITLENKAVSVTNACWRNRTMPRGRTKISFLWTRVAQPGSSHREVNGKTDEIGQTSNAIFRSLHISMSFGCLINENLDHRHK